MMRGNGTTTIMGMHERDLHLLADALANSDKVTGGFGQLAKIGVESESYF